MIVSREKVELSSSGAVAEHLRKILKKGDCLAREREHFWVITLSTNNRVKFVELVSLGTLNASLVHPREVFRRAIKRGACSIVVGHNHPSGNCKPSQEDIRLTKQLKDAGAIIGIDVLDHVIIGDRTFSFREEGLI
ncbi:MAG: JAB domain-containing protein [Candidatus Paceibacterota bacterium]|jgi:DNA repair protein RadC